MASDYNAKEKCEIISFRMGLVTKEIAELDIHIGNYQMMTLIAFVYAHFVNTQLKNDTKEFKRNVNNRVQNNIIKMFQRQGTPITGVHSYKAILDSCLDEWSNLNKNKKEPEKDTTNMICEYFESEGIDFSEYHRKAIEDYLRVHTKRSDDTAWNEFQKTSGGCLIPIIISLSSFIGILLIILIGN